MNEQKFTYLQPVEIKTSQQFQEYKDSVKKISNEIIGFFNYVTNDITKDKDKEVYKFNPVLRAIIVTKSGIADNENKIELLDTFGKNVMNHSYAINWQELKSNLYNCYASNESDEHKAFYIQSVFSNLWNELHSVTDSIKLLNNPIN